MSRVAYAILANLLLVTFVEAFVFTDKRTRLASDLISVVHLNLKIRFLGASIRAKSHRAVPVVGGVAANRHDMSLLDIGRGWSLVVFSSFSG